MAAQTDRGVPLSTLSPKFLHSNSTSHTWPFSAIAELIDNAYDPDVSAKQFWIDKTVVKNELCLTFMDNGYGLTHEAMHKMLSFGYSDKTAVNGQEPIGIYGNGFKSGSMRLGKDAIVFSKSKSSSCVGMLSQTYLEKIKADQIIVPIVCFEERESNRFSIREEHKASLQDILRYSLFTTQEELLTEINAITLPCFSEKTGTRIIIWNLRRTSTGSTEFDFEKDRYDIQIPSEIYETLNDPTQQPNKTNSYIPECVYSLRAYCSILYLKPRMQVVVRGQKVKSQLIAKSLAYIRKDHYKPMSLEKRIPITFGYNTKSKDQYGIMMYHKNRLIKAYERVGCQLKANNKGVGVIGVIECNFLEPTHNKQSFSETDKYRKTINSLGIKLEEYWNEIRFMREKEFPTLKIPVEDAKKRPDQNWVQCDDCLRWRKLPDGIDVSKLPDKWFCRMNPDPQFRSCQVEEEAEDSDDDQPSYRKTYKQHERENKRKLERRLQLDHMAVRHCEGQHLGSIARESEAFRNQHENLARQLQQTSPSTPTTPRRQSLPGGAVRAESSLLRSSTISQAAYSPSTSNGPVISNVRSLSVEPQSWKRPRVVPPQSTPKRPRINGFQQRIAEADVSSTSVHANNDENNNDSDDTDDEIEILETASTPKPNTPVSNSTRIKQEEEEGENLVNMLLECSDDAAVDVSPEGTAEGMSTESSYPSELVNSATQTTAPEVKKEPESQNHTEGKESASSTNGAERRADLDVSTFKQRSFKQENGRDDQRENKKNQALHNGVAHMESGETPGPSGLSQYPSIDEVQKQQDQLMELMQDTAQERDSLKEEVQRLNSQLEDMQSRLEELSHVNVKKECSHQACQTESQKDYKSLFEKAKKKVNDLIKDKEALLMATDTKTEFTTERDEEQDSDEISQQVGCLVRELDQRTKERDDLRSQVDSLQEEKSNLAAQCEELKLSLQQQREEAQSSKKDTSFSAQTCAEQPGGSGYSTANFDTYRSLIELRQNVGRLLIFHVPALDLEQVNFQCDVIDEILEQTLNNMDKVE